MTAAKDEAPFRSHMQSTEWYASVDAGIRFPVRVLHAAGVETCQSCEGGPGHAYDGPTVDLPAEGHHCAAGFAALSALGSYGIEVAEVSLRWAIHEGLPTSRIWRVVLRQAVPERAEEQPGFVHGYMAST